MCVNYKVEQQWYNVASSTEKKNLPSSKILATKKLFDITLYCRDFFNFIPNGIVLATLKHGFTLF